MFITVYVWFSLISCYYWLMSSDTYFIFMLSLAGKFYNNLYQNLKYLKSMCNLKSRLANLKYTNSGSIEKWNYSKIILDNSGFSQNMTQMLLVYE